MSRIGRMPITVPAGVDVNIDGQTITVKGPNGTLTRVMSNGISAELEAGTLHVKRAVETSQMRALHGLNRALIHDMVVGVSTGFTKELEVNGVGYRVTKEGNKIVLSVGYSHNVEVEEKNGITFDVPTPNKIVVKGADKQAVGQIAAEIRKVRPPEPYKGKGIKYANEVVRRKEGKTGK